MAGLILWRSPKTIPILMSEVIPTYRSAVPGTFLGVRHSIWKVAAVVAGGGIGALISGQLYSDYAVFGAVLGVLLAESVCFAARRKTKAAHAGG